MPKSRWWWLALLVQCAGGLQAQEAVPAGLLETLQAKYPGTRFSAVNPSPLTGVYEVVMGRNIAYTDARGDYFLFGHVMDMARQRDVTADRQNDLRKINFSALPPDSAITFVQGNGRRQLAVFSDPDCPYCRQLEAELAKLEDVTIRLYPYPLAGLHPEAMKKAQAVWCSPDRARAWRELLVNRVTPKVSPCETPLARNRELAASLGIAGTPVLIRADGRQNAGALKASELDDWLDRIP